MTAPATVTLTGTAYLQNGQPAAGQRIILSLQQPVRDGANSATIYPISQTIILDSEGRIPTGTTVVPSDAFDPVPVSYLVQPLFGGADGLPGDQWFTVIPSQDTPVDLFALAPLVEPLSPVTATYATTVGLGEETSARIAADDANAAAITQEIADRQAAITAEVARADAAYDPAGAAAAAQGAAVSAAEADATAKANAAQANAETYADGKVAALVGSAPSILDTLQEIDAALGDDANLAADLTAQIAAKAAAADLAAEISRAEATEALLAPKMLQDTAANLTANDPVLVSGRLGYETDTGQLKIGDGTTAWNDLPYWLPVAGRGVFADLAAPFFAAFGSGLAVFEDFHRPDIANLTQAGEGYAVKSGQPLHADGAVSTGSILAVTGNRGQFTDGTPGATPIRIAGITLNREPTMIGMRVNFSTETTSGLAPLSSGGVGGIGVNAVMGTAATSFAQGSVQIGLWRSGLTVFVTENPLVTPYHVSATVTFDRYAADDDTTDYAVYAWFDRAASSLTFYAPGLMGAPQSVADPLLAQYWGKVLCYQERRQASTDGRVAFTGWGASFDAPNDSGVAAALSLPYQQSTYLLATPPDGYTPTDPQVDLFAAPTGGWNNGTHTNVAAALWNAAASNRCFAPVVLSNGKPAAYLSADGTTTTGPVTCSAALPADASGVRIRYEHTTGNVRFYSTTDPATATSPTWTELGTAGGTNGLTAGTLLHAPPRRTPLQVGTRDNSSALMFGGQISRVTWTDGGTVIGDCDLRTVWLDTKRRDSAGLTWYLTGAGWSWVLPTGLSLFTSKGDLLVGTGAGTAVRLPVGADGTTPIADSTQTSGIRWGGPPTFVIATMPTGQAAITANADTTFWTPTTIATSEFAAGSIFRIKLTGKLSMPSGAGSGASVRCKVAGTTLVSPISTSAPTSTYTDKLVTCLFDVWIDTAGASGVVSADGAGDGLNASGALSRADISAEGASRDLSGGLAFTFSINLPASCSFTPLRGVIQQVK